MLDLFMCVPVTGLVSLILSSVAGAPRSSFSREMTRSGILMKLLIYRSLLYVGESRQMEGHPAYVTADVSIVVGVLTWWAKPPPPSGSSKFNQIQGVFLQKKQLTGDAKHQRFW